MSKGVKKIKTLPELSPDHDCRRAACKESSWGPHALLWHCQLGIGGKETSETKPRPPLLPDDRGSITTAGQPGGDHHFCCKAAGG